ncbi:hypothetical protein G9A89_009651 [Geosiphon pyriformis]|nr:hypothetical protein G9A89_009651 [Geosiphon pyriformis]
MLIRAKPELHGISFWLSKTCTHHRNIYKNELKPAKNYQTPRLCNFSLSITCKKLVVSLDPKELRGAQGVVGGDNLDKSKKSPSTFDSNLCRRKPQLEILYKNSDPKYKVSYTESNRPAASSVSERRREDIAWYTPNQFKSTEHQKEFSANQYPKYSDRSPERSISQFPSFKLSPKLTKIQCDPSNDYKQSKKSGAEFQSMNYSFRYSAQTSKRPIAEFDHYKQLKVKERRYPEEFQRSIDCPPRFSSNERIQSKAPVPFYYFVKKAIAENDPVLMYELYKLINLNKNARENRDLKEIDVYPDRKTPYYHKPHYQGPPLPPMKFTRDSRDTILNMMIGCLANNKWLDEALEVFYNSISTYNVTFEQKTIYSLIDNMFRDQNEIPEQEESRSEGHSTNLTAKKEKIRQCIYEIEPILKVWKTLLNKGVKPDHLCYSRMIYGIAYKDPMKAKEIFMEMMESGHQPQRQDFDLIIYNLFGFGSKADICQVYEIAKSFGMTPSVKTLDSMVHEANRFQDMQFLNLFYKDFLTSRSQPIDQESKNCLRLINESIAKQEISKALNYYNTLRKEGLSPHPTVTIKIFEGLFSKKNMHAAAQYLADSFTMDPIKTKNLKDILHYVIAGFTWNDEIYMGRGLFRKYVSYAIYPKLSTWDLLGNAFLDKNMPLRAEPFFVSHPRPTADQLGKLVFSLTQHREYKRVSNWLPRLEAIKGVRQQWISMTAILYAHCMMNDSKQIVQACKDLWDIPTTSKKLDIIIIAVCQGLARCDDLKNLKEIWNMFLADTQLSIGEQQFNAYIKALCQLKDPDEAMRILVEIMRERNIPPKSQTIQFIASYFNTEKRSQTEILKMLERVKKRWPNEYYQWEWGQIKHFDKL